MGHTLKTLSDREAEKKAIFNNRFVVEVCEQIHVHYRNLRILMSLKDFISMAEGMKDALKRWEVRGKPEPNDGVHIELCRKEVATSPVDDGKVKVNLNDNLYLKNDGKIFSEGAELLDEKYIHLKWRDLRIECTLPEFITFSDAIAEARRNLDV